MSNPHHVPTATQRVEFDDDRFDALDAFLRATLGVGADKVADLRFEGGVPEGPRLAMRFVTPADVAIPGAEKELNND